MDPDANPFTVIASSPEVPADLIPTDSWVYYVKVNQAFCDRIVQNFKKGDVVWVHDYHLLLLPGMLRERLPDAKIGLFMHTAFPSSEVFRVLATRTELCEGVLGSNMVAFQTDEYAKHFLQTCSRILNVEANKDGVFLEDGRVVRVHTVPISISPKVRDPGPFCCLRTRDAGVR